MTAREYLATLSPNVQREINNLHDKIERAAAKLNKERESTRVYFEPIVDQLLRDADYKLAEEVLIYMPDCPEKSLLYRKIAMVKDGHPISSIKS